MGILEEGGVKVVYHYTPLHYLVFIARDRLLRSKPSLRSAGFAEEHLRSKSAKHDIRRGFGEYAFLTIEAEPRITKAKLRAGFPHVGIGVPVAAVDATTYDLTRFNVAMTRRLRRDGALGWPETLGNGRYYDDHQIPVARTEEEKIGLISQHLNRNMIEVLVHGDVQLPDSTSVLTYSDRDRQVARKILDECHISWEIDLSPEVDRYEPNATYAQRVDQFVTKALDDPSWRGNGLEFDKV